MNRGGVRRCRQWRGIIPAGITALHPRRNEWRNGEVGHEPGHCAAGAGRAWAQSPRGLLRCTRGEMSGETGKWVMNRGVVPLGRRGRLGAPGAVCAKAPRRTQRGNEWRNGDVAHDPAHILGAPICAFCARAMPFF
jgi:hypothetical protein